MSTEIVIQRFLELQNVAFSRVGCPWDVRGRWQETSAIPHAAVARPVFLQDARGMVMVAIPITDKLELVSLNRMLQRQLRVVDKSESPPVFAKCQSFIQPALGSLADLECVVDTALLEHEFVYIASGADVDLIRLSVADFQRLNPGTLFNKELLRGVADEAGKFDAAHPGEDAHNVTPINHASSAHSLRERIENTAHLPAMPSLANRIIQLNADPYSNVEDLAKLLEKDPSLSAQIVRYAQSPFFGFEGTVASVRQAISMVLGYDMVMNIALGFAASRPFRVPRDGPIGLRAYWRHAVYTAALAQALCESMPAARRPKAGTAYLTGLLHNFGLLILGHVLPKEFAMLDKAIMNEPETPLVELEQRVLGATHMEMGCWLMTEWNMPAEVITVTREHHNLAYEGPHVDYVRLVALGNYLLKNYSLGDAESDAIPEGLLEALGLKEAVVSSIVEQTMAGAESLETMAQLLVA